MPVAPGTFGTLAGVPFILFFSWAGPGVAVFGTVLLMVAAVWISDEAEAVLGQKDPGCIVIDEVAGYVVAMAGLPVTALSLIGGFLAFRFFDILKPFPVKLFEERFHGGAGVVLDDIVAGLYAGLVLRLAFMI